jgi:uncharacterized membrane-anchored protein
MSKVPEVTLLFWMVKIAATTLGETGGDALSMSLGLGYLAATGIFAVVFAAGVVAQTVARRFHPALYWSALIASTTLGTTLADFATRSLGIGYPGGSLLLALLLVTSLVTWRRTLGTVAISSVSTPTAEAFYWLTIMLSQTLGTALGDWTADTAGLGYLGAMALFGGLLMALAGAYRWTRLSHTVLFWSAFVLTRPLGAVVGDFLDKPLASGGLGLDRFAASAVLLAFITLSLLLFRSPPARSAH